MSMNLYVGAEMAPWQTPTHVTRRILSACRGATSIELDLSAIDLYESWVLASCGPPALAGKDARNPYLVARRGAEVAAIRSRIDELRAVVRSVGGRVRQVTAG